MPQGGVDNGEDFLTAMRRELYEETSIKNIKIIKEIIRYMNMSYLKILLELYGKVNLEVKNKNGLLQSS